MRCEARTPWGHNRPDLTVDLACGSCGKAGGLRPDVVWFGEMPYHMERIGEALGRNPILVTALNSVIGYDQGAKIAKAAYQQGRPVIEVAREMTDLGEEELARLLDPATITRGGIAGK